MYKQRLISLLETCCLSQGKDDPLMIDGRKAKEYIASFFRESGLSPQKVRQIWEEPEFFLGKFAELPQRLQKEFAVSASFLDKEYLIENTFFLRCLLLPVWYSGNMFISTGEKLKIRNQGKGNGITKYFWMLIIKIFFNIGATLIKGTFRSAKKIINSIRFTRFYRQPFFYAFWKYLHVDIQNLYYSYVERIPVDVSSGAVWRCAEKSSESTALIGLDFVPSGGKLYFIEANFNAGFGRERLLMYKDHEDPIGKSLILFALEKNYKTIHIYGHNESTYFNLETERSWKNIAYQYRIDLQIIDDLFSASVCRHRKKRMVPELRENTLNVLVRAPANALLLELIAKKGNLENCIRKIDPLSKIPALPEPSGTIRKAGARAADSQRFPKIIIKHRMKDDAKGITIVNSYEIPDEYQSADYLVTEFLKPDLIAKTHNSKVFEYVYKYRSILLLTTDGPRYLGSYILRSGIPVPSDLPRGILQDISPFIANYSYGGAYERVSEREDNLCKEASLAVGDVIHQFLKRKIVLEIASESRLG